MTYASKKEKFIGGIQLLKSRAPVLGGRNILNLSGSFAMWGGLFSLTDCALVHLRNKEDYFNNVVGGFVTGGLLAVRCKKIQFNCSGSEDRLQKCLHRGAYSWNYICRRSLYGQNANEIRNATYVFYA
jgi:hypothetical protein